MKSNWTRTIVAIGIMAVLFTISVGIFVAKVFLTPDTGAATANVNYHPQLPSEPTSTFVPEAETPPACPRADIEHQGTGRTKNAVLITHTDMQHPIETPIRNGKVLILEENKHNGHQWMVYYLPACQFGFIDKNQVVLDQ